MADRPTTNARPPEFNSLVAAAEVITSQTVRKKVTAAGELDWQRKAWEHYDAVGEFRFGIGWVANGMSRVNLTAAGVPTSVGDEPVALQTPSADADPTAGEAIADESIVTLTNVERRAIELTLMIGGGTDGQGLLLGAFGRILSVSGLAWLVVEPKLDDPTDDVYRTWNVYTQSAVKVEEVQGATTVKIRTGGGQGSSGDNWRNAHANALVVKCWRPHPDKPWEPDSQVRGVLNVLDQIDLLTAHVTATGRSRLAGAGVFPIPSEATFPDPPPPAEGEEAQEPFDYFVEQFIEAMITPIQDRDNASAVVPLVLQVPGEMISYMKDGAITFSTPFDDKVESLLTQAVRRLALGLDMPPEVLLGLAGVNHWTAWQVEDTAVTLHIEPNAETVCQALTEGFLRPALLGEGFTPEEVASVMVWYDTSTLTTPPDKSGNAQAAYDRMQISGSTLRRESGFSDDDAPDEVEFRQRVLLDAAKGAPTLAPTMLAKAGLLDAEVGAAAEQVVSNDATSPQVGDEPVDDEPAEQPPDTRPQAAGVDAIVMACDGIVYRAMERAGGKLRNAVGRKAGDGPQATECDDITTFHTLYDATAYADLNHLLDGALNRVPDIANDLGLDADALASTLDGYMRGLLAAGHPHDRLRLSSALGIDALLA